MIGARQACRQQGLCDVACRIRHIGAHAAAIFVIDHMRELHRRAFEAAGEKIARRERELALLGATRLQFGRVHAIDPYSDDKGLPEPDRRPDLDGVAVDHPRDNCRHGPGQRLGGDKLRCERRSFLRGRSQ